TAPRRPWSGASFPRQRRGPQRRARSSGRRPWLDAGGTPSLSPDGLSTSRSAMPWLPAACRAAGLVRGAMQGRSASCARWERGAGCEACVGSGGSLHLMLPVTDEHLPALFRASDRSSLSAQRRYLDLVRANLVLIIVGSVATSLGVASRDLRALLWLLGAAALV